MKLDVPQGCVPLQSIDFLDPNRFRTGSQAASWATLREQAPVWRHQLEDGPGFWCVTRHSDVSLVLRDDQRFTSEKGTILDVLGGDSAGGKTINLMDPPKHTWVRMPTMRTMTSRQIADRAPAIRDRIRELIAPCLEGEPVDFAQQILPLAMTALGELMQIPESCWRDVARWAMTGVAPADPVYADGDVAGTLRKAHYSLFELLRELIRERRARPGSDLISVLLGVDFGGRPLPEELVLLNCYSFLMGANTTTPHVASHLVLALAERPDVWPTVAADRALVPSTVEEALRWASPTNHLMRRASTPLTLGGMAIEEGDAVCAWIASANRDADVFRNPYEFDPRRSPNPHLGFGIGVHYCIGAPAARVALTMLLEELVDHVDQIEFHGEPTHLESNFINGVTHLPVVFRPRA